MAEKNSRKRSGFVIYSYFKDSTFIAVKVLNQVREGATICQQKVYVSSSLTIKAQGVGQLGRGASPYKKFLRLPPSPPPAACS